MRARFSSEAGIAIGAILFVIAIIAVISIAMTASGNFMGTTIVPDRVNADLKSQANLIRNKILECYTNGYDRGELADKYPASDTTGTYVENLECPSYNADAKSLWSGQSPATLPPPPQGLEKWVYMNAGAAGGRCIRIQPAAATVNDVGIKGGLALASSVFSSMELVYDSGSASQRFILWITKPTVSAHAQCSI